MKILGHRTDFYPSPLGSMGVGPVGLMTVLTVGDCADYAAYRGIVPDVSLANDSEQRIKFLEEWVARSGDKISKEDAVKIWPGLAELEYRI